MCPITCLKIFKQTKVYLIKLKTEDQNLQQLGT